MSNGLTMTLAEWLMRMSVAKVSPAARMLAIYATVLDVTGNEELANVTGISGRTFDKHKRDLVKDGWVLITRRTGGRGKGIEVSPAVKETPVKFADVSQENPRSICARLAQQTPAIFAEDLGAETPAEIAPVSEKTPVVVAEVSEPRALAPAYKELPSEVNISIGYPTTTTVEQASARDVVVVDRDEFAGLNGTAVEITRFIAKHAVVDEMTARRMLKTNIQAFGVDAMLEAYSVTMGEMASKAVAAPYKFLMGCARNAKDRKAQMPKAGTAKEGSTARTMRIARELEAQQGRRS